MPRPAKATPDAAQTPRTHIRIPAAIIPDVATLLDLALRDRTPVERRLLDPAYLADLFADAVRRRLAVERRKAAADLATLAE